MAMEIMEELARLCDSLWPPPTDMSLRSAGLDGGTVKRFQYWLRMRFDRYFPSARLLDEAVTAEIVAAEINSQYLFHRGNPKDLQYSSHLTRSSPNEAAQTVDGSRDKPSPPAEYTRTSRDRPATQRQGTRHLTPTMATRRLRKDLSIDIVEERMSSHLSSPSPPSSGTDRSPRPSQQSHSQSSRKTGLVLPLISRRIRRAYQ